MATATGNQEQEQVDSMINAIVDQIWKDHDTDDSGALDRNEAKGFVCNMIAEMQGEGASKNITEEEFEETFQEFDTDKSGLIERGEMVSFLRKMYGCIPPS